MPDSKGFTLTEILTVLIIIGLLAAIAAPNYNTYVQQAAAQAAQNNLISIYGAQKNFYLSPVGSGNFCVDTGPPNHICSDLNKINTNLSLNITDNNFTYKCARGGGPANGFQCTATNISAGTFKLIVTNNPIVLPGGSGTINPSCTYPAHPNYCPS